MSAPQLDPAMAKHAAELIQGYRHEVAKLASDNQKLAQQIEKDQRRWECLTLAHKLAENGRIPSDFQSIMDKAEKIASSDKSLAVIKEAHDFAQNDFDLGGVNEATPTTGGSLDPLTEVILSLG